MSVRVWFPILVLLALLAAAIAVAIRVWQELDGVAISTHGWIAMALGAVGTVLVGAGLMTLVFFSSRRGSDERANRPDDRGDR
jgi:hypothetical protein